MSFKVSVNDSKYTVVFHDNGKLEALRYGETWRSLTGDNLIYWVAVELQEAREKIICLEGEIEAYVCAEAGEDY